MRKREGGSEENRGHLAKFANPQNEHEHRRWKYEEGARDADEMPLHPFPLNSDVYYESATFAALHRKEPDPDPERREKSVRCTDIEEITHTNKHIQVHLKSSF